MINYNQIKVGDFMLGEYNGKLWEGEVTGLNGEEKQVCLLTDVQEFWFEPENLYPIPLNDEQLVRLNFTREMMPNGSIKYKKGAFRLQIPSVGDFSRIDIWYREDRRHNPDIHYIHQLQNHYLSMTKVHLTRELV
jgi:hypothetical protein